MKKWEINQVRSNNRAQADALAESLGLTGLTGALLYSRGFRSAEGAREFMEKKTESFFDPFLMMDMESGASAVLDAVARGEKIYIYGDYDVDGVTSVSLLYLYLKSVGADIGYYIPSREGEGYGVNSAAVDKLHAAGAELIITVDTGVTARDEVEYARTLGIDFVITDHHACLSELPRALAVINPHRPDCGYPFKELAGVGVVFKLICALEYKRNGGRDTLQMCTERMLVLYADLVTIGTVADVMPLCGENRLIVSLGTDMIEKTERVGLRALMRAISNDRKRSVNCTYIGFSIAPRINAAGRMGSAQRAAELFLTSSEEEADKIAAELCEINKKRQQEENDIFSEAAEIISRECSDDDEVTVLAHDGWHQGVIGIVASRVADKYSKPAILITFDGDTGKGSGRSVRGVNLVEALASCSDCLEQFGGHELAAGLTVKRPMLARFKKRLNAYVKEHRDTEYTDTLDIDCEIFSNEVTVRACEEVACLEPYGTGNPEPLFALTGALIAEARPIGGGKHTRFVFEKDGIKMNAVWFGCNLMQTNFYMSDTVDVACRLSVNEYMGVRSAQLIVTDMRLSGKSAYEMGEGRQSYESSKTDAKAELGAEIIPDRQDFACVYRYIQNEVRRENNIIGIKGISRRIESIGYAKARYIIDIFRETNLVGIESYGPEPDIYKFRLKPQTAKVNLEKSSIYKKLRSRKEHK